MPSKKQKPKREKPSKPQGQSTHGKSVKTITAGGASSKKEDRPRTRSSRRVAVWPSSRRCTKMNHSSGNDSDNDVGNERRRDRPGGEDQWRRALMFWNLDSILPPFESKYGFTRRDVRFLYLQLRLLVERFYCGPAWGRLFRAIAFYSRGSVAHRESRGVVLRHFNGIRLSSRVVRSDRGLRKRMAVGASRRTNRKVKNKNRKKGVPAATSSEMQRTRKQRLRQLRLRGELALLKKYVQRMSNHAWHMEEMPFMLQLVTADPLRFRKFIAYCERQNIPVSCVHAYERQSFRLETLRALCTGYLVHIKSVPKLNLVRNATQWYELLHNGKPFPATATGSAPVTCPSICSDDDWACASPSSLLPVFATAVSDETKALRAARRDRTSAGGGGSASGGDGSGGECYFSDERSLSEDGWTEEDEPLTEWMAAFPLEPFPGDVVSRCTLSCESHTAAALKFLETDETLERTKIEQRFYQFVKRVSWRWALSLLLGCTIAADAPSLSLPSVSLGGLTKEELWAKVCLVQVEAAGHLAGDTPPVAANVARKAKGASGSRSNGKEKQKAPPTGSPSKKTGREGNAMTEQTQKTGTKKSATAPATATPTPKQPATKKKESAPKAEKNQQQQHNKDSKGSKLNAPSASAPPSSCPSHTLFDYGPIPGSIGKSDFAGWINAAKGLLCAGNAMQYLYGKLQAGTRYTHRQTARINNKEMTAEDCVTHVLVRNRDHPEATAVMGWILPLDGEPRITLPNNVTLTLSDCCRSIEFGKVPPLLWAEFLSVCESDGEQLSKSCFPLGPCADLESLCAAAVLNIPDRARHPAELQCWTALGARCLRGGLPFTYRATLRGTVIKEFVAKECFLRALAIAALYSREPWRAFVPVCYNGLMCSLGEKETILGPGGKILDRKFCATAYHHIFFSKCEAALVQDLLCSVGVTFGEFPALFSTAEDTTTLENCVRHGPAKDSTVDREMRLLGSCKTSLQALACLLERNPGKFEYWMALPGAYEGLSNVQGEVPYILGVGELTKQLGKGIEVARLTPCEEACLWSALSDALISAPETCFTVYVRGTRYDPLTAAARAVELQPHDATMHANLGTMLLWGKAYASLLLCSCPDSGDVGGKTRRTVEDCIRAVKMLENSDNCTAWAMLGDMFLKHMSLTRWIPSLLGDRFLFSPTTPAVCVDGIEYNAVRFYCRMLELNTHPSKKHNTANAFRELGEVLGLGGEAVIAGRNYSRKDCYIAAIEEKCDAISLTSMRLALCLREEEPVSVGGKTYANRVEFLRDIHSTATNNPSMYPDFEQGDVVFALALTDPEWTSAQERCIELSLLPSWSSSWDFLVNLALSCMLVTDSNTAAPVKQQNKNKEGDSATSFEDSSDSSKRSAKVCFERAMDAATEKHFNDFVQNRPFGVGVVDCFLRDKSGRVCTCQEYLVALLENHFTDTKVSDSSSGLAWGLLGALVLENELQQQRHRPELQAEGLDRPPSPESVDGPTTTTTTSTVAAVTVTVGGKRYTAVDCFMRACSRVESDVFWLFVGKHFGRCQAIEKMISAFVSLAEANRYPPSLWVGFPALLHATKSTVPSVTLCGETKEHFTPEDWFIHMITRFSTGCSCPQRFGWQALAKCLYLKEHEEGPCADQPLTVTVNGKQYSRSQCVLEAMSLAHEH